MQLVKEYAVTHKEEGEYWEEQIADLNTNKSKIEELVESETTQSYAQLELDEESTRKLLTDSNKAYHTQINDLLLSALVLALAKITNSNTHYIMLEGHGREEIADRIDITGTVGWFTSMYPICLTANTDIGELIKATKESLRSIPNKGIGFGAMHSYTRQKLPRISFNYLGQFSGNDSGDGGWNIVNELSGVSMDSEKLIIIF